MYFLILTLVYLTLSGPLGAEEVCSIKNLQTIEMPPLRSQGATGDCYAFAGLALIQDWYCKNLGRKCLYVDGHDDSLSVLDAIGLTNHKRLQSGGHTQEVLSAVRAHGGLFKESCAPFSSILKNGELAVFEDGRLSISEPNWHFLIRRAMEKSILKGVSAKERKEIAQNLSDRLQLFHAKTEARNECRATSPIQVGAEKNVCDIERAVHLLSVENSLTKRDISIVAYDLFTPQHCNDRRITLKTFSIHPFNSDNIEEIRSQIDLAMKRKTPLATNICGLELSKTKLDESTNIQNCGPHATIISGMRENCCGSVCNIEYQFYDSAKTFGEKDWLSEKKYFDRLKRSWKLNSTGDGRRDLMWIE